MLVGTDFEDVKNVLKLIFTMALHATEGFNLNAEPTACEQAKQYLKKRIATQNIEIYETDSSDYFEGSGETVMSDDDIKLHCFTKTSIFEEIKRVYDSCQECSAHIVNNTGSYDNMQFYPSIAKRLLDFCKLIPCWSALMVPFFKYGNKTESSSTSESLFKVLKSIVFKHKSLPLRLNEFLEIHINSIIGSTNLIRGKIKDENKELSNESLHSYEEISEEFLPINNNSMNVFENDIPADNVNEFHSLSNTSNNIEIIPETSSTSTYEDESILEN